MSRGLTGGPQSRMSNLRNDYVTCHYFYHFHVDLKLVSCLMSMLRNDQCHANNSLLMSIGSMSHVDCHCGYFSTTVEFQTECIRMGTLNIATRPEPVPEKKFISFLSV